MSDIVRQNVVDATMRAKPRSRSGADAPHFPMPCCHRDPDALDWLANRKQALLRVTHADLMRVAGRCLDPASLSTVILRAKERARR